MSTPPLRVCFVCQGAYPYFRPEYAVPSGGAELQLHAMATGLAEDPRFAVHFVVADHGQPDAEVREGVTLHPLPGIRGGVPGVRTLLGVRRLHRLLRRVDAAVYLSRAWGVTTGEVALFCRAAGRKYVYLVANDEELRRRGRPSWLPPGARNLLAWRVHRAGMRLADLIVVQHEAQRAALAAFRRVRAVVRPSAHRAATAADLPREDFVLWVSRCDPGKRPGLFLDLARSLPDRPFVMICSPSADAALFARVRAAAAGLGNLRFLEFVPHPQTLEFFRRARLLVNTSQSEGFPNTFVEAAMHGTPIVSLQVDPDGILARGGIGRCAGGDPALLGTMVRELLNAAPAWEAASARARAHFLAHHDLRTVTERDRELLLALAGPRSI